MLIQFSFKNFKSFRDEAVLDLSATKITEFSDRVVSIGREKLLPVAAIYGANASGKSNLISALYYFESFIFNQFYDGGNKRDDEEIMGRMPDIQRNTFRLSDEPDNSSEFEIIFVSHGKTYQYGFSMS